jgi:malonyl-CoA O-methyltransferase
MQQPPAARSGATLLSSEQAYDRLASAYPPHAHNVMMEMEQAAVIALLGDVAGRRCLDLGCGSGRYLRLLREAGAARAVGLDLSAAMLVRARAGGFGVARGDAARLPFGDAAFDVVVCGLMVGHVAALFELLAEVSRVLAPGGVLVYSDVHPAGTLAGWQRALPDAEGRVVSVVQHLHLYTDHVGACRAAGLEVEALREPRVEIESPWHGWPAVLALRAVRSGRQSPR